MKRNIFFTKKNNFLYIISFIILFFLITIYLSSFYININKPFFIIDYNDTKNFVIPENKEGQEIKFLDKKSINQNNFNSEKLKLNNIENVNFTIQLFSNTNFTKVKNYMNKFINLKFKNANKQDLYLFAIETDIGIDYFFTYKNFFSRKDAIDFCERSKILDNCMIINLQNE